MSVTSKIDIVIQKSKDVIAILGGLIGVFVVLLWLAGRSFTAGYYEAMNIPYSHITLSVWEYAERGWTWLVGYSIVALFAIGSGLTLGYVVWVFLESLVGWAKNLFETIYQRVVKTKQQVKKDENKRWLTWIQRILTEVYEKLVKRILLAGYVLFVIIYICSVLLVILLGVQRVLALLYDQGIKEGNKDVTRNGTQVELISDKPLVLGTPSLISTTDNSTLYLYQGFRLLTYNDNRYYVFENVDSNTCRPESVYIVDRGQLVQVNLSSVPALMPNCVPQPVTTPAKSP